MAAMSHRYVPRSKQERRGKKDTRKERKYTSEERMYLVHASVQANRTVYGTGPNVLSTEKANNKKGHSKNI